MYRGGAFICTDPAGGTVYAAFLESMSGNDSYGQVCVKRWDGAAWQQVGTKIGSVSRSCRAVLAVCGGEVYLSYLNGTNQPMYCRLENGAWKQVASHSAVNPKYMQFAVDGSSIYAAYEDSGTWKIYDLKTNKPVDSQLKARDFSHPAMLASDGSFIWLRGFDRRCDKDTEIHGRHMEHGEYIARPVYQYPLHRKIRKPDIRLCRQRLGRRGGRRRAKPHYGGV